MTQSYVWLLCGFHQLAQKSLAAAYAADANPDANTSFRQVLAAGARCDSKALAELGETSDFRSLVRLIEFQIAEPTSQSVLLNRHCEALLEQQPGCLRPLVAYQHHPHMGPRSRSVDELWSRFPGGMYEMLKLVPNVPDKLLKLIEQEQKQFQPAPDSVELEFRMRLIRALVEAGEAGRDTAEPSLATLGQLLLDVNFLQVISLLQFNVNALGVNVDETIKTHRFMVSGHPYEAYLEAFASDPVRVKRGLESLEKAIKPEELKSTELFMLHKFYYHHSRDVYGRLIRHL